ncbi:TetR/AcrR family transcriptional regulator [Kribbella albertanoniae]|uniref:TetR/AcrR family transcriptional regulator n=1 Tax=Kribbella albertanoniae TaxID=1266829 RepID=A0A4R4PUA9_9ACTN|nr:TetR/AcrR family transcriptional regulator [Kribbella albertanoniae]TDC26000.1 TetR/AcrR family transcriptional regulator [Kribbella albertanoniae]
MALRADAARNRAAILAAASEAFAQHGPKATTEQVAQQAGVAVGTVFRHFPTKDDLLIAIMKESLERLATLANDSTLAEFFGAVADEAVRTRMVVTALGDSRLDIGDALRGLTDSVRQLLERAKAAGEARPTVQVDEVMALLTAATYAAQQSSWTSDLRHRTLAVILRGLR